MVFRLLQILSLIPIVDCLHFSISLLREIIHAFYIKINSNQFNKSKVSNSTFKLKCQKQTQNPTILKFKTKI